MAESGTFIVVPKKRKVWVLNKHPKQEYREKFRDEEVVIPPNNEKKVIWDLAKAERFLSVGTQPQELDNAGREISIGKPIYWLDLTEDERDALDPVNKKRIQEEEKEVENMCTICGDMLPTLKGLKLHVTKRHPDYEPVTQL